MTGGFDECSHDLGHELALFELEVDVEHDLCDDVLFDEVCDNFKDGTFDEGSLMSPPV